eukprot:CAMPEP_0177675352 /NCGR_PEP_ID=MMETSP0447-20121125/27146_1 /TAXON_ID=0 /ORGANISM="Stygamoeba regulata, Strain BSH-02190019" /LENGTH=214 /DNA_ID=CAMNT_0019183715 /DNA_START=246 /DNA_END=887 /DNA_ORIENTATION=-
MTSSLPVEYSSSIFLRFDEDHMDLMQAAIVGPPDTPYSDGIFLFDMYCTSSYPAEPPKVSIRTTGGGTVRFNPNLYANGKVCLSLLGTWQGESGETWNARTSTMYQVLMSIQSLIMVAEPYYNEPGYQTRINRAASDQYIRQIRLNTIRLAMVGYLEAPPRGFEEVVHAHFYYKRDVIKRQCFAWLSEAELSPPTYYSQMLQVITRLSELLDAL